MFASESELMHRYTLQPFTRYSRKEKTEAPKCQMLAANILKLNWRLQVKNLSRHTVLGSSAQQGLSYPTLIGLTLEMSN